jgi:ADP-ribose pyrophosphatase
MTELPATLVSSRTLFEGRVFDLHSDLVRLPHGREATMDVIRHAPSVVLVPMPDPAHIVLIRQYRYAVNQWLWELPAGSMDPGETPEVAAARECHEEIGQLPVALVALGSFLPTPGICDEAMHFFRLDGLVTPPEAADPDPDEVIVPHTVSVTEARQMLARGEITDMKTALALSLIP